MLLPSNIPHTLKCPKCKPFDGKYQSSNLKWDFHTYPINGVTKSEYLVYHCDICNARFTTTESDTISIKRYKSKKRSLVRKEKITNLIIKLCKEENFYTPKK
jgi:hypothetical protein